EPIEQFRVRRQLALRAEVADRLDETDAEHLRPETIDGHSRRQGVLGTDQPFRQPETIARSVPGQRREDAGYVALDLLSAFLKVAPNQDVRVARLRHLLADERVRDALLNLFPPGQQLVDFLVERIEDVARVFEDETEIIVAEARFLSVRPLAERDTQ